MKSFIVTFAFAFTGAATAASLLQRTGECCFGLAASGSGYSGSPVEQLSDGQLRIGQTNLPGPSSFCLANGGLTDSSKRGCIVTPPTSQIQCDSGAQPSTGFTVDSSGVLAHNGSTTFYACPTGDNGGYNIYTAPLSGQVCKTVTLTTTGSTCPKPTTTTPPMSTYKPTTTSPPMSTYKPTTTPSTCPTVTQTVTTTSVSVSVSTCYVTVVAPCPTKPPPTTYSQSPPPPPPSTYSTAPTTTTAPPMTYPTTTSSGPKTCPTNLSGAYQFPHLIVPVNSSSPSTAYGTSYFGAASSTISSVFNFDIPPSYAGQTCTVVFLFPTQAQLQTSSFTLSGSGGLDFSSLASPATQQTTYNSLPAKAGSLSSVDAQPGNAYVVASGPCAAGQTVAYLMAAHGSYSLRYFQDYNPSPIGLYITVC